MKLSERIAKCETMLERGTVTSDEFDAMVIAALEIEKDKRKQNNARYHVAITNNTEGGYAYGTTDHYVDAEEEVKELHSEWFEQDSITAVHFLRLDGVKISSAIKTIGGSRVTTTLAIHDRQYQK